MLNSAIFLKTFRDSAVSLLLAIVGLIAFQILFVWAMLNMGTEVLEFVSKVPFITKMFEMSLGIKVDGEVSLNILFAVCYTHAVALSLVWFVVISTVTRTTVGEVERGTADMLLTLPVSRPEVYFSTSLVWWTITAILSYVPIVGMWIGLQIFNPEETVDISRYIAPATNFLCLHLCVGGLASMVSCLVDRRGVAVGAIVSIALVSAVLNLSNPRNRTGLIASMNGSTKYHRPVDVVRTGEWPIGNMVVLVSVAVVCWIIGLIAFSKRDIPTA